MSISTGNSKNFPGWYPRIPTKKGKRRGGRGGKRREWRDGEGRKGGELCSCKISLKIPWLNSAAPVSLLLTNRFIVDLVLNDWLIDWLIDLMCINIRHMCRYNSQWRNRGRVYQPSWRNNWEISAHKIFKCSYNNDMFESLANGEIW